MRPDGTVVRLDPPRVRVNVDNEDIQETIRNHVADPKKKK